jgi:hypothetical protein
LNEVGGRKEQAKQEMAKIEAEQAALNNQMETRKRDLFAAVNQLDGAMQDVQYLLKNWVPQDLGVPVLESPNGKVQDASQTLVDQHSDGSVPVDG